MQVLDIFLAFALLMVVFSSIAAGVTELLLRALRSRSKNLQSSIALFARNVIWPNCEDLIADRLPLSEERQDEKDWILTELNEKLTQNPTVEDATDAGDSFTPIALLETLNCRLFPGIRVIDKLSTEAFVQRFANTSAGAIFAGEGEAARAARLKSLTLAFERYMATSAERYRKRATIAAMMVSIVFAGAANIQFGALVNHLRDNPAAIESIISDSNEIVRQSKAATDDGEADDFQKSVEELSTQLEKVRDMYQLPIGWGASVQDAADTMPWPLSAGLWLLNILIAGLLIGLGAPFWYAVVKNVGQVRAITGAISRDDRETVSAGAKTNHEDGALERHQAHANLFDTAARLKKPTYVDDTPPPVG